MKPCHLAAFAALLLPMGCTVAPPAAGPAAASRRGAPAAASPAAPLIGQEAPVLIARFGVPVLDVREGPARKLQFRGACVLDLYLYPPAPGAPARATYAEARTPQGGEMDRAACIALLQQR